MTYMIARVSGAFLLLLAFAAGNCEANNNFFLPGDAFFATQLTAVDCEQLQNRAVKEHAFTYSMLDWNRFAFCGYAGYTRARFDAVDTSFRENLTKAYARTRKNVDKELREEIVDGKTILHETNGVRVLFYPREFDLSRFTLALRYNENWVAETLKFGHRQDDIRPCELVNTPNAMALSWRDANRVGTFMITVPDVPLTPVPPADAPVTIKSDVKAVVLSESLSLARYMNPPALSTILIVDSTGIVEYQFQDGNWEAMTKEAESKQR